MTVNKNILKINESGQSIWYDYLSKELISSGELEKLIELGVTGLTSNPSIFKKAIADTKDYDEKIKKSSGLGLNSEEIITGLMISDVQDAADLFMPIFEKTKGDDGYVSLEVSPELAYDTEGTVAAGKELYKRVGRKNLLIKVPATKEGIPAIEKLLTDGINVNVTLIFSIERYKDVVNAYNNALKHTKRNLSEVYSVASFFVSRVDAAVEKEIASFGVDGTKYLGEIGLANCRLAYKHFNDVFKASEFTELSQKGARKQKLLWASTSTKNRTFDPQLYTKNLVGPSTINTLPPKTLAEIFEKFEIGTPILDDIENSLTLVEALEGDKINFPLILKDLEANGVKSFSDAYSELLNSVQSKM